MSAEYRRVCEACGMDEVVARKPKRTPWHWPRRWSGSIKKCWATPRVYRRTVTKWEPLATQG